MGTISPAFAAPTDSAEAEALMLSGASGLIDLDDVAELAGPYSSYPPGSAASAPLDLTALQALEVIAGVNLLGDNGLITLGAVGQYASTDIGGSFASSGLIGANGAIQAGTGAAAENTTINLTPVLDAIGAQGVVSGLSVELGALAASASADRTDAADMYESDYQIASGTVSVTSPLLGELSDDLDSLVAGVSTTVNGVAADGGAIDTAVNGLLGGLDAVLEDLLLGLVDLDDPSVTATVATDLSTSLDLVRDRDFVSGPVTINLGDGTVLLDLDELHDLNNAAPNTVLLDDAALNATITAALSDILTNQLPTAVVDAVTTALSTTPVTVAVNSGVSALGLDLGDVAIAISGTLGGFVGIGGQPAPDVDLDGTSIAGLPLGTLLTPVTDWVTTSIVPAVGGVLDAALDLPALETGVTDAATGTVTALDPLLGLINEVVSITINVQEDPGTFRNADGTDAESFTQRAVTVSVLPGLVGGLTVNLASATVRATPAVLPVITGIDPGEGPETGGTLVTLTGSEFTGATGVTFDGVPATDVTVVSDTEITAVSPAHDPGVVDVVINGADGNSAPAEFEYLAVPSISSITPTSGPEAGGTVVTVTGDGFTDATGVTFGDEPGVDFTVDSDTQITVTTPPGTGDVPVVVEHPVEDSAPGRFSYVAAGAPTVMGLAPDRGPETGGTTVTITGDGFDDADVTAVTVDGEPVGFTIVDDATITLVTPPHAPGAVDVRVINDAGSSAPLPFEYFPVTNVDGVDPGEGPSDGGNTVTLTGACFAGATDVLFGGISATEFTVVDDNTITAVVPAGTAGLVDVTVVGAGDCGEGTLPDGYEYVDAPVVTGIAPDNGPETGGTTVVIEGDNLDSTTGVTVDGENVDFVVNDDATVTIVTPPHAPGVVAVEVESPGGVSEPVDFTYLEVPGITSVAPDRGPTAGGTPVTITGSGFTDATGVLFDGNPGTSFVVVSDTQITVTTPAGAAGAADVVVLHPNGASLPGIFTYVAPGIGEGGNNGGGTGGTSTGAGSGSAPGALAHTGSDVGGLAALALALIAAGAAFWVRRRKVA